MSSQPLLDAGIPPPPIAATNPKKRVLSDSEDTEERDAKRSKPRELALDKGKQKDTRDRKKRRKKKRKMSVVQAAQDSDEDSPVRPLEPPVLRAKSLPASVADGHAAPLSIVVKVELDGERQPSAGPSTQVAPSTVPKKDSSPVDFTVRLQIFARSRYSNRATDNRQC